MSVAWSSYLVSMVTKGGDLVSLGSKGVEWLGVFVLLHRAWGLLECG